MLVKGQEEKCDLVRTEQERIDCIVRLLLVTSRLLLDALTNCVIFLLDDLSSTNE